MNSRNLRYKDPRDPSLPPSTAVRMMVYGEYHSVRLLLDLLEDPNYREIYIPNNMTQLLTSVYGKVSSDAIQNLQISSVHPIRLDGEYVFILPFSTVSDGDTAQMLLSLLLVVGVCFITSVAIFIIHKCEKMAVDRRKRIAKRKWALAHPEWKKSMILHTKMPCGNHHAPHQNQNLENRFLQKYGWLKYGIFERCGLTNVPIK